MPPIAGIHSQTFLTIPDRTFTCPGMSLRIGQNRNMQKAPAFTRLPRNLIQLHEINLLGAPPGGSNVTTAVALNTARPGSGRRDAALYGRRDARLQTAPGQRQESARPRLLHVPFRPTPEVIFGWSAKNGLASQGNTFTIGSRLRRARWPHSSCCWLQIRIQAERRLLRSWNALRASPSARIPMLWVKMSQDRSAGFKTLCKGSGTRSRKCPHAASQTTILLGPGHGLKQATGRAPCSTQTRPTAVPVAAPPG